MSLSKKTITFSILILLFILIVGYLWFQGTNTFPKGSRVANILVEGYSETEAREVLEEEINNWKSNDYIYATSESDNIQIPRSIFIFDIDATLEKLRAETKSWLPFFNKVNIEQPFVIYVSQESRELTNIPSYIDMKSTLTNASLHASNLSENTVELVYSMESTEQYRSIATKSFTIPSSYSNLTIDNIIKQLNSVTFAPKSTFSFTEEFPDVKEEQEDEINLVASQLYSLILLSNFIVLERHSQGTIPVYTDPGIEVAINPKIGKDLLFLNPNDDAYKVKFERKGDELISSLQSTNEVEPVQYHTRTVHEVEPRTVYRYSDDLGYGQQQIVQEGVPGIEIEVYRTEQGEDKLISKDFYPPEPQVVFVPISSGMIIGEAPNNDSDKGEQYNTEINQPNGQPDSSSDERESGNSDPSEENLNLPMTFYDFVVDYCENLKRNGLDSSHEEDAGGGCPENLDNNQLQLLRLIWTFYSQDASENQQGYEKELENEEKEIFVK